MLENSDNHCCHRLRGRVHSATFATGGADLSILLCIKGTQQREERFRADIAALEI
eukprot:gene12122-biopygen6324